MSFYDAKAKVEKIEGTQRRVTLETGHAFETGVHGAIKSYYRLDNEKDLPLPVDYIVGATGA
ncbi:MAG TPA: hypothetical protein VGC44_03465 [Longimicrobiales bacterium]